MITKRERCTFIVAILSVVCGMTLAVGLIEIFFFLRENPLILPVKTIVDLCVQFLMAAAQITLGIILYKDRSLKPLCIALAVIFASLVAWFYIVEILALIDFVFSIGFYYLITIIILDRFFHKSKFYRKYKILFIFVIVGLLAYFIIGINALLTVIYVLARNNLWLYLVSLIISVISIFLHDPIPL